MKQLTITKTKNGFVLADTSEVIGEAVSVPWEAHSVAVEMGDRYKYDEQTVIAQVQAFFKEPPNDA